MPKDKNEIYNLDSYTFDLPEELIAKYPVEPRDNSRLLVLDKESGHIENRHFHNISEYLEKGDTLVINETKVIPARLYGYKETGAQVEVLLLKKAGLFWEAIVRPAKRLRKGAIIKFPACDEYIVITDELDIAGGRLIKIEPASDEEAFINRVGQMPLPPYINRAAEANDKNTYQTVFAKEPGSAAAPTAGLHFTEPLLEELTLKGINVVTIVLHVGLGTFRPVSVTDIREHKMHTEYYHMGEKTALILNQTKRDGKNIVAVGTTVVRTLETIYTKHQKFISATGETDIFIYPGYEFKAINKMITNFHLPGSSLIMLVAAFAGRDNTLNAYQQAVQDRYRFFSYGDAMFIK